MNDSGLIISFLTHNFPIILRPLGCSPFSLHLPLLLSSSSSSLWQKLNVLCEITSQEEIPPVLPDCSVFSPGPATMCVLHKWLGGARELHSSPVSPGQKKTRRRNPTPRSERRELAGGITTKATGTSTLRSSIYRYKAHNKVERP